MQAVIPINVIEASKSLMREPTRRKYGEGCQSGGPKPGYGRTLRGQDARRGKDDGMHTKEHKTQHGRSHAVGACVPELASREVKAGPGGKSDRLMVPMKPGNAGGGTGPSLKGGRKKQQTQNKEIVRWD